MGVANITAQFVVLTASVKCLEVWRRQFFTVSIRFIVLTDHSDA